MNNIVKTRVYKEVSNRRSPEIKFQNGDNNAMDKTLDSPKYTRLAFLSLYPKAKNKI